MSAPALRLLLLAHQVPRPRLGQARPARHQRLRHLSCRQTLPFVHGLYQVMAAPAARAAAVIPISAMSLSQVMSNQDHRQASGVESNPRRTLSFSYTAADITASVTGRMDESVP